MTYSSLCYCAQMSRTEPENTTVRKAAKGNRRARRQLFVQTYYEMFQMVRDLSADDADRYEILLEGYINAYEELTPHISQEEFPSFLQGKMTETATQYLQENKSADKKMSEPGSDKQRHILAFMEGLRTRQKQMMVLHSYDGLSISATAKVLQQSPGELRKSRRQLQKSLRQTGDKKIRRIFREDITCVLIREMGTELLSAAVMQKMWASISHKRHSQYVNGLKDQVHNRQRIQQLGVLATGALSLCLVAVLGLYTVYGMPGAYKHLPPSDLWPTLPFAFHMGEEPQPSTSSANSETTSNTESTSSQGTGITEPSSSVSQEPDDFQPDYRQGYANRRTAVPAAAYQKMGLDRQDMWTYYSPDGRTIFKQKDGSSVSVKIGELPGANSLQVVGDWVYTCSTPADTGQMQEGEGLYRIRTDGSRREQLIAGVRISSFVIYNDTVYFISTWAKEFSSPYRDTGLYAYHISKGEGEALLFSSAWQESARMLLIGEDIFIFNESSRHVPERYSILENVLTPVLNHNLTGDKLAWEGEGGAYFPAVWDEQSLYFSFGKTVYQTDYTSASLSSQVLSIQGKTGTISAELQQLDCLVPVAALSDRSLILQGTLGSENTFYRYSGNAYSHYGEPWGDASKLSAIRNWAVLPTGDFIGRSENGFYQISEDGITVQQIFQ